MYFLGSFNKEARTLWHGTSLVSAQSIMKEGLIPSIGQWTESAYGGTQGWGTSGLLDTSFAADKEELSRAMGGIAAQVAGILNKDFYQVTDEEFIEYGALIKITEGDKEMEHYRPPGEYTQTFPQSQSEPTIRVRQEKDYDPESDEYPDLFDDYEDGIVQEELKPNAPAVSRHVEPGDWFTREEIPPERLSVLTGNKMIDVFRRAGLWPRMWGPSREENVAKQWVAYQMRNHYDEWVDHMEEEAEDFDEEFEEPTRQEVAAYLMDYSSNLDLKTLRKQIPTSLGLFERGRDYDYDDDLPDESMEDDFMYDPRESPNHYRRKRHRNSYIEEFEKFAELLLESDSLPSEAIKGESLSSRRGSFLLEAWHDRPIDNLEKIYELEWKIKTLKQKPQLNIRENVRLSDYINRLNSLLQVEGEALLEALINWREAHSIHPLKSGEVNSMEEGIEWVNKNYPQIYKAIQTLQSGTIDIVKFHQALNTAHNNGVIADRLYQGGNAILDQLSAIPQEKLDNWSKTADSFNKLADFVIEGSEKKVEFLVNQYPKAEKIIRWLASKDPSGQRYKYLNEMWDAARAGADVLEIPLKLRYRLEIEKLRSHPIAEVPSQLEDATLEVLKKAYIQLARDVRIYNKKFNILKENFGSGRAKEIVSQIGDYRLLYLMREDLSKLLSVKDDNKIIQDIAIRSIKQEDDRPVEEIIQEARLREENAKIKDHGDGLIEYLNYDAASFYRGLDTEWCWAYITSDEMWESYSERGRLFSLDFNGELIGIFLNSEGDLEEIRDAKDNLLTGQKLQDVVEILKTKLPVRGISAKPMEPEGETSGLTYEEVVRQYELHGAEGEFLRFIKEFYNSGIHPNNDDRLMLTQDQIENSVNNIDKFYDLMKDESYVLYSYTSDKVRDSIIEEFLKGRSLKEIVKEERIKSQNHSFGDEERKVLNSKAYKKLNNIFDISGVIYLVKQSSADEVIRVLSHIEKHYRKGNLLGYNSQKIQDLILSMLNIKPQTLDDISVYKGPSTIEEHSEKIYKIYDQFIDDDKIRRFYDPDRALEEDEEYIDNSSYEDSFNKFAELVIEAQLKPEVKIIRDEIKPWAGKKAKVYAMWLYKHSKSGEPLEDIIPLTKFHAENLPRLRGREADINSFKNPGELQRFLEEKFSSNEDNLPEAKPDAVVEGWKLYFPQSEEESCAAAGSGTTWCTARRHGENAFYNYALEGINLIYAVSPDGKRYSLGYRNGELINGDPAQGGAGYGGVTVDQENDGIDPAKILPPKVLEQANALGEQPSKVKNEIRKKLKTPEGINDLFDNKRYDFAKHLLSNVKEKMPEEIYGKEEYLAEILHNKLIEKIRSSNYEDIRNNLPFYEIRDDISRRMSQDYTPNNDEIKKDLNTYVTLNDNLMLSTLDYFDHFQPITQLSILNKFNSAMNGHSLAEYEGKNLPGFEAIKRMQDISDSGYKDKILKEIISKPKHYLSHKLDENELRALFGNDVGYEKSKDILRVLKDRQEPSRVMEAVKDAFRYKNYNFDLKALVEVLPEIILKTSEETRKSWWYEISIEPLNLLVAKKALKETDVDFEDIEKIFEVYAETRVFDSESERHNLIKKTNTKYRLMHDLIYGIDLEEISPKNQDKILSIRYLDSYGEYTPKVHSLRDLDEWDPNKEDEDGNRWIEPYDPDLYDTWTGTQTRLRRKRIDDLIDPEVRQRIKERQKKDREDALSKDVIQKNKNTDFYEEEWLDDKYVASFEDFAEEYL